jgi:hypothetical protein
VFRLKWGIFFIVVAYLLAPSVANAHTVRKIKWSGTTWTVRHTDGPSNPGANIFSDNTHSAWVDSHGRLALRIYKGRAVELAGKGHDYGTFTWSVASDLSNVDFWRVVGLFLWTPNGNELDMEFARWGVPDLPVGWTVGWVHGEEASVSNFAVTPKAPYTVRLTWTPLMIKYEMTDATGAVLINTSYAQMFRDALHPNTLEPHINHWMWPGAPEAPETKLSRYQRRKPHPVLRLNSFRYTPLKQGS